MDDRFELFDHTANLGVRVFASNLPALFHLAGQGLYATIGELQPEGDPRPERFSFTGGDLPTLMRDYLAELHLIFDRDHRMVTRIEVQTCEENCLEAVGESRAVCDANSLFDREVKAITYHGLSIEQTDGGFVAEYIVDI